MSPKAAFTGGKLNLKGDKHKKKKKKHSKKETSNHETHDLDHRDEVEAKKRKIHHDDAGESVDSDGDDDYGGGKRGIEGDTRRGRNGSGGSSDDGDHHDDEDLTEAERKSLKFKRQQERKDLQKIASMSHRERVEQFNEKIGKLTEHNDIPRVSAAGNG